MNVAGVALPGMPGIVSGHNDRIAWGETNLGFDVQDLYIERMDLRTGQYLFQGKIGAGPRGTGGDRRQRPGAAGRGHDLGNAPRPDFRHAEMARVTTLRWAAAEPGVFQDVFPDIDRARNWDEFRHAISRFGGPGQNFVYADVDGNIGYQAGGKLPIRRDLLRRRSRGRVFREISNGTDTFHSTNCRSRTIRPAGLSSRPIRIRFPPDYPYHVSGVFAAPYRSRQILNMLRAGGNKLKPEDNLRIQKDVYSGFDKFLGAANRRRLPGSKGDEQSF